MPYVTNRILKCKIFNSTIKIPKGTRVIPICPSEIINCGIYYIEFINNSDKIKLEILIDRHFIILI